MYLDYLDSPIGVVEIHASEEGVTRVGFVSERVGAVSPNNHKDQCKQQLKEYFSGLRQTFDLSLAQEGTAFQQSVWQQLLMIPFGKSAAYRGDRE